MPEKNDNEERELSMTRYSRMYQGTLDCQELKEERKHAG